MRTDNLAGALTPALQTMIGFVERAKNRARAFADSYERWSETPQGKSVLKTAAEIHQFAQSAQLALDQSAERVRTWAESPAGQRVFDGLDVMMVAREIGDFYARAGIYRPLDATFLRDVLEQVEAHAPHDLRRSVDSVAPASAAWTWICEGLLASPSLARWKDQLAEALDCMEDERWHASVSTLLPIIEGVIAEKSGVLENMRVGRRLEQLLDSDQEGTPDDLIVGMVTYPALKVIDAEIFAKRGFATTAPDDPGLNRHTILHGVTGGFGTRENAVRVLMVIIALAETFDGPVGLRASTHEMTDATLMRDFGPIAKARRRAATGAATAAYPTRSADYAGSMGQRNGAAIRAPQSAVK
ncbi:hypothetical protein PAI11_22230 [Patulibacter medicamentivorans]|uniref:Uncharacterized protein n=1 Tax=Patulibacter medicamentivorans TaxID=1097667 RepID=H0E5X2_9ACTN|nr:hypothetical protein PAI11_22230 [Patulibacter medicamentivorans]